MKNTIQLLHGELKLKKINKLPSGKKSIVAKGGKNAGYHILAASESLGNHHVIDLVEGVEVVEIGNRKCIVVADGAEATVRCLHENRHDTKTLPPGIYDASPQQEFDYIELSKKNVQD